MADFDERSGIVSCQTPWGLWYQTLDEVSIEVNLDKAITSKDIAVKCDCTSLSLLVGGKKLINVSI